MRLSVYSKLGVALGIMLCLVSMVFSVLLCIEFGSGGLSKSVLALAGLAVQGTQTVLFIFGCYSWKIGKRGKGVFFIAVWAAFFGLSIVASVSHFSTTNVQKEQAAKSTDDAYLMLKERYDRLGRMIDESEARINDFARRTIITRGVKPETERQKGLIAERNEFAERIAAYKGEPAEDKMFYMLAEFMGVENVNTLKLICFFVFGFLVDLGAVCLLFNDLDVSGGFNERFDEDTGRSGGGIRKSLAGQSFMQPAISGGSIAKSDGEAQFQEQQNAYRQAAEQNRMLAKRLQALESQRVNPELLHIHEQNRFLLERLKRLEQVEQLSFTGSFKEPVIKEPVIKEPVIKEPVIKEPVIKEPVIKEPLKDSVIIPKEPMSHALITEYVSTLFSKPKPDGSLIGRNTIADSIGISYKDAATIHNFLKTSGFIEVKGNSTYPIYDRDQILAEISRGQR